MSKNRSRAVKHRAAHRRSASTMLPPVGFTQLLEPVAAEIQQALDTGCVHEMRRIQQKYPPAVLRSVVRRHADRLHVPSSLARREVESIRWVDKPRRSRAY